MFINYGRTEHSVSSVLSCIQNACFSTRRCLLSNIRKVAGKLFQLIKTYYWKLFSIEKNLFYRFTSASKLGKKIKIEEVDGLV